MNDGTPSQTLSRMPLLIAAACDHLISACVSLALAAHPPAPDLSRPPESGSPDGIRDSTL
jgi:hypothetical protein